VEISEYPPLEQDLLRQGFCLLQSSAFRGVKWDDCNEPAGICCKLGHAGHLTVAFHPPKGKEGFTFWLYKDVPRGTYDEMLESTLPSSPGKFFAREIKGKVPSMKLIHIGPGLPVVQP